MDPKYLAAVTAMHGMGISFTPAVDKHPWHKGWTTAPRETLDQALAWAKDGELAVRTGAPSGLVIIDVEKEAAPGVAEALGLPPTIVVQTGDHGFHHYYRSARAGEIKSICLLNGHHVDVKARGGACAFVGTVHPETRRVYEFLVGPDEIGIADLPDEFVERYKATLLWVPPPPPPATPVDYKGVGVDDRHPWVAAGIKKECEALAATPRGGRNAALNKAAFNLGGWVGAHVLSVDKARELLIAASHSCGLLTEGKEEHDKTIKTIESSLARGEQNPRVIPDDVLHPKKAGPPPPRDEDAPVKQDDEVVDIPPPVYHVDNVVRLFLEEQRRIVMYYDTLYRYTGKCYRPTTDTEMEAMIMASITGSMDRRREWTVVAGRKEIIEPVTPRLAVVSQAFKLVRSYGRTSYEPDIPHWLSTGAPAPDSLIMANGVLNTTTLEMGPHTNDLFSLVALPYKYDPDAQCPNWLQFVDEISCRDEGTMCALQELFGYCLTPGQDEQKIFLFIGEGENGKSVCSKILEAMLGDGNFSNAPIESLDDPHATAPMVGKLANISEEWHHIEPAAEGVLKAISGGDRIHINPKHKTPYTIPISAKLIIITNEAPSIKDKSLGMWRRLFPISFLYRVHPDKRIPKLEENLKKELPGILNWALEGLRALRTQKGFTVPDIMKTKLEEYRSEVSPTWTWSDANLDIDVDANLRGDEAYTSYARWAKDNGYTPLNSIHFGRELGRWYQHHTGGPLGRDRVQDGRVRHYVYSGLKFGSVAGVFTPPEEWR